jgi:hypothetical protein
VLLDGISKEPGPSSINADTAKLVPVELCHRAVVSWFVHKAGDMNVKNRPVLQNCITGNARNAHTARALTAMSDLKNPDRNVSGEQSADNIAKGLFEAPPMTVGDLACDSAVRLRIGRIINLFLTRKKKANPLKPYGWKS